MQVIILFLTFFVSSGQRPHAKMHIKSRRQTTNSPLNALAHLFFAVHNLPDVRESRTPRPSLAQSWHGQQTTDSRQARLVRRVGILRMTDDDFPSDVDDEDIIVGGADAAAPLKSVGQQSLEFQTMLEDDGVGIRGRWREVAGNFVSYPRDVESVAPKGVIHFLGGAFVGAAPHITYRYLLDALCDAGYVVVTTPYRLGFDYLETCETILTKFDVVGSDLAARFGSPPVIGIGHSCGALLQTLISSTHPDSKRDSNVLISFNNKDATEAIPGFDDIVVPISEQVMGTSDNQQVSEAAASVREAFKVGRDIFNGVLTGLANSDLAPSVIRNEVVPAVEQGLEVVDQIPDLLSSIASGTREFKPSPAETKEIVREKYRSRKTLLIQFDSDDIDETPEIERVLRDASEIDAADASQVADDNSNPNMNIKVTRIGGTHVTPLTQNVFLEPSDLGIPRPSDFGVPDPLLPVRDKIRENFLRTVTEVKDEIVTFLS